MNTKGSIRIFLLILMLLIITATSVACERAIPIIVVNQTDQTLTVFINKQKIGTVNPGAEIKNENRLVNTASGSYFIEAKDTQGNTVYSKSFTYDQLTSMDRKVVISPP